MARQLRLGLLIGLSVLATGILAAVPPIPQDPSYHHFADRRSFFGIPNAWNVLSNAAFVFVGGLGLWHIARRSKAGAANLFSQPGDRWPYVALLVGIALTGVGSAYYHLAPDDARLVWDRLAIAVAFAAIVAMVLLERISVPAGLAALPVLLIAGVGSALYWHVTEARGAGDLRPYAMVQFSPSSSFLSSCSSFRRGIRGAAICWAQPHCTAWPRHSRWPMPRSLPSVTSSAATR